MTSKRAFRCQPEAVTAARRFVRETLGGRPAEVVEAAELMASELATNCVRHARTDFELSIRAGEDVRIDVRDSGGGRPMPRSPGEREPSGRGLRIVEAMSDAWGVITGTEGKTVWFTLRDRDGSEPAGDVAGAARATHERAPAGASPAGAERGPREARASRSRRGWFDRSRWGPAAPGVAPCAGHAA